MIKTVPLPISSISHLSAHCSFAFFAQAIQNSPGPLAHSSLGISLDVWVAIAAALIGAITAWVYHKGLVGEPRKLKGLEFKLRYVEQQLKDLYGPLFGVVKEHESAYEAALAMLSEDRASEVNPFEYLGGKPKEKQDMWIYFTEQYFLKYNDALVKIIARNRHLLGPAPPTSIEELIEHTEEYKVRFLAFKDLALVTSGWTLSQIPGRRWPVRFIAEVEGKTRLLEELQKEYRMRIEGAVPEHLVRRDRYYLYENNQKRYGPYTEIELRVFAQRAARQQRTLVRHDIVFGDVQIWDETGQRVIPYRDLEGEWSR